MKKKNEKFSKLFLRNTLVIFACLLVCITILFVFTLISYKLGFLSEKQGGPLGVVFIIFLVSLLIGAVISVFGAKKLTKPIKELENATNEITKGNFDIQVARAKNPELENLIDNFNKMARELKNNETLKSDFISNVSHEFKTPLAIIKSTSQALQEDNLDKQTKEEYQEILNKNISKLTNLTSNILCLSKIENQEIVPNKTEFLLDEQIRYCILSLEPEWQKKNIEFDLKLPKTTFYGSQELLSQVWQNIIGNAIKFSHENGKISISLTSNEDIIVRISDNGIGMNEETQKRIFDKFYQGDTSHSKDGNGLGLVLVSRILKISNGEITVKSKENKGTTFVITLKQNN